ncbi:MAG: FAD-dependent oxidoreductase [Desulfobulbia bacterium]
MADDQNTSQKSQLKNPSNAPWHLLAQQLGPRLISHLDPRYLDRSIPSNLRYTSVSPQKIALCESTEDVQACVKWLKKYPIEFAIRSGGHSYAAFSSSNGLLIDVSSMKSIEVDPENGLVKVGAGVNTADLLRVLPQYGLMIPTGICPTVGVSGLCLGGGWGYFARQFGLTCDALIETDIIGADGNILPCNSTNNAELFWALRGGAGGNFGINTSFTFNAFEVKPCTAFTAHWYSDDSGTLIGHLQKTLQHFPVTIGARILLITPLVVGTRKPIIQLVGNNFDADANETKKLFKRLFAFSQPFQQSFESLDFWQAHDVLADAMPYDTSFQIRTAYLDKPLNKDAIGTMLNWLERWPGSSFDPVWITSFFLLGGAINSLKRNETAYVHRNAQFLMVMLTAWDKHAKAGTVTQNTHWISSYFDSMQKHVLPESYQNFPDLGLTNWSEAYYGENLKRLQSIKRKFDQDNFFHFPQSIPVNP